MRVKAEFHFDFGSLNAYFAHKVLPEIEARTGVPFVYVPILLGGVFKLTNNQSPMVQFKDTKNKLDYQFLEIKRFIARHALSKYKMNPHFPVNTMQVMRGAVAAGLDGSLAKYADTVFCAMWEDGKRMDDADVIRAALDAAGLDSARLLARTGDQDVKDILMRNTQSSVDRGNFGSPTFFIGSEMFFGKDRLREVEEEIVAAKGRMA